VGWRGPEHELYERSRAGKLRLAISSKLLAELERVLRYPKLGFTEEVEDFISDLLGHASMVRDGETVEVVEEDPDDNRVIECALAAGARWIVSGDKHLLGLEEYEGIRIVGAATAVKVLGGS